MPQARGTMARRRGPAKSSARTGPYPQPSSDVPICPKHGKPGLPIDEDKENASPKSNNNDDNNSPVNSSPDKESDRSNLPNSYRDIPLAEIKGEVPVYENVGCLALFYRLSRS